MNEVNDPMIGRVFHGTIEITRLIGVGGMGKVYEGYQKHLDRKVAVKVMTAEHAANPIAAEYFMREAKSASRLRHPNIIQIIDFGQDEDDTLFLAMEFVPGEPLTDVLTEHAPLPARRVVRLMSQVLSAMDAAHAGGIIHRDLKPDNIMVETMRDGRDFIKLLDFGVAQIKAPDVVAGPLTMQGAIVGTPQYMSPEQVMGDAVDGRSDLFALGAILYELLTCEVPFDKPKAHAIMIAILKEEVVPPSARRPDLRIDSRLEAIALRALNKNADLRYQTAREFKDALEEVGRLLEGVEPASTGAAPAQYILKRSKRKGGRGGRDSSVRANTKPPEALKPKNSDTPTNELPPVLAHTAHDHKRPRTGGRPAWTGAPVLADEATSAPSRPSTDIRPGRPTSGLGLDLEELRSDLIGERREIISIVMQQRHHKRLDAEEMVEVRAQVGHIVGAVCERWHALLHGQHGSFTTLAFGLPTPRGDDAVRAAQAALELRAELDRLEIDGAAFTMALESGEVFCPSADFSQAAGPPIDAAGELARLAGDGEILVGTTLIEVLATTFKVGADTPNGARPLLGMRDAILKGDDALAREDLVGRDAEMAELLGVLGRVTRRQGASVMVTGEPGVGKSALIRETLRMAEQRGHLVLKAHCRVGMAEGVRDVQRQWLMDLLRQRGNVDMDTEQMLLEAGTTPTHARLLGGLAQNKVADALRVRDQARASATKQSAEQSVHVSLRGMIRVLMKDRPVILSVDGAPGLDGPMQSMFERWTAFVEEERFMFLLGVQTLPGATHPNLAKGAVPLHVDPLDESASEAYLRVNLRSDFPRDRLRRIARVSGGYPINLVNLKRIANENPNMSEDEASQWLARSRDVREVLKMRLYQQKKESQNVMAALSVLGHGAKATHLLDLVGERWSPEQRIEELQDEGLIEIYGEFDDPTLFFVPQALGTLVYDQLSRKMKARIHGRAVAYYEELISTNTGDVRESKIMLARHLEGSGEPESALRLRGELAAEAMRAQEFAIAKEQLEGAIALAKGLGHEVEVARMSLSQARCLDALGSRREAIDLATRLDREKGLPELLALEIRVERGRLWLDEEDPLMVEQVIKKAVASLNMGARERPGDDEWFVMSLRGNQLHAEVLERQGKLVQAGQVLLQVIEETEARDVDARDNAWGPSLIWEPLNQLGRVRLKLGSAKGALQLFELALQVSRDADDARGEMKARGNLSAMCTQQGRLDAAQKHLTRALVLARKTGEVRDQAKLEHNRGLLLRRQRRVEPARQAFEESMRLSRDMDWREGIALNMAQLSEIDHDTSTLHEWEG